MVVDRGIGGTFYGGFDTEGDYLYIPDALKGVLVVDISNPMEYKQIAAAQCDIPYDRGITVYNGYLYAQDSGNVLVFDVRNPEKPKKLRLQAFCRADIWRHTEIHLLSADLGMFSFMTIQSRKNRYLSNGLIYRNTNNIIEDCFRN